MVPVVQNPVVGSFVNYILYIWKSTRFMLIAATKINSVIHYQGISYIQRTTMLEVVGDTKMVKANLCSPGPSNPNKTQTLFCTKGGKVNGALQPTGEGGRGTKAGSFLGDMGLHCQQLKGPKLPGWALLHHTEVKGTSTRWFSFLSFTAGCTSWYHSDNSSQLYPVNSPCFSHSYFP